MDTSISSFANAKTKNELINKAHEARLARELPRRQEKAATTIQASVRTYQTKKRLRVETDQQLKDLIKSAEFPDPNNLRLIIKKVLFLFGPDKDRDVLNSLLQLISDTLSNSQDVDLIVKKKEQKTESEAQIGIEKIELSEDYVREPNQHCPGKNFINLVAKSALNNEKLLACWLDIIEKILDLCVNFIRNVNLTKPDCPKTGLQFIVTYLYIINTFSSKESLQSTTQNNETLAPITSRLADELSRRMEGKTRTIFRTLSKFISKIINLPLNQKKACILRQYLRFTIKLLEPSQCCLSEPEDNFSTFGRHTESIEILTDLLSIPALTCHLEKQASDLIKELNDKCIFRICLKLLVTNDQNLQRLSSTPALCLLANIIHIASFNEDVIGSEMISFVVLVTKLLESCQRNMKQTIKSSDGASNTTSGQRQRKKAQAGATDESYNHILGWLAREQAPTIDKDSSKLIKGQLSHLWSMRFLKILLNELTKLNEKNRISTGSKQAANSGGVSSAGATTKTQGGNSGVTTPKHKTSSEVSSARRSSGESNLSGFVSPALSHFAMIKRAVERAATTMTKTISSPYGKTSASVGSGAGGSGKLMTEEAARISLVCFMLHTALKTFKIIKQDILSGLCLHDYIPRNLWIFISSLGPHNGLKAFLDHLAIHTKTNAPEFHILTLFCECTSHLISILDDSELYEQQKPFGLDDLIAISAFLNSFVFRIITNHLVSCDLQDMDPILQSTHKLLTDLYKRDCRRKFAPQDHWLIKEIKMSMFLKDLELDKPIARTILTLLPHIIPPKERILIFRKLVAKDKSQYCSGFLTFITIHRSRIVEDGYQQLARLPPNALKGLIRVKFINDHGLDEAGIDQDGVFKEFLEDTIKRVFDPALNLFCSTSEQRLYPSPTSRLHEDHLSLFNFIGKMLGKAIYEGIVVDVPFASFFLSRVLGQPQSPLYSPIDELPSLDPELYKSLTYIKHYEGDVSELDLTFSIDQDFMGKLETYELESGGKFIPVTRESRVRYIHSVANFRMKTQIEQQTEAFVRGFKSIIDLDWLSMFSTAEFQRLISGDESPIDLQDLRKYTKYFGGFHSGHRVICWLWDILEKDFSAEEHRLFLKFVTSCSKPPLLGFANLEPPFTIRCVEVSDDQDLGDTVGSVVRGFLAIRRSDPVDRLPTSSTCFNMLKLPNYQRRSTLKEKLRYAIRSSPGFELS